VAIHFSHPLDPGIGTPRPNLKENFLRLSGVQPVQR
jgi:hypothetical protein